MGVLGMTGTTWLVVVCTIALVVPQGFGVLTEQQCFDEIKSVDSEEFVQKTLACQNAGGTNDKCCNEINSMYGYFGTLDGCLCGSDFHSMILENMPVDKGITAEKFVDDLKACGIPAKGLGCGGETEAPVVQAQGILARAIHAVRALRHGGYGPGYHTHGYGGGGDDDDDDDDDDGGARPIPVPKYTPPKKPSPSPTPPRPSPSPAPQPPATPPAPPAPPKATASPKSTGVQRQQQQQQQQNPVPTHPPTSHPSTTNPSNGCQSVMSGGGAVDFSAGGSCVIIQG